MCYLWRHYTWPPFPFTLFCLKGYYLSYPLNTPSGIIHPLILPDIFDLFIDGGLLGYIQIEEC